MSSFEPPIYNSDKFNSGLFQLSDEFITLGDADARYLKLAGGVVRGFTTFNVGLAINGTLTLNGDVVDLTYISGVMAGTATASKALVLDSAKEIGIINAITSNIYNGTTANIQFINTDITTNAISCNSPVYYAQSTNNTGTNQTYQRWSNTLGTAINVEMGINNVSPIFGTSSNHPFRIMTNGSQRMLINSAGNISIGNSNNTYKLDVTGVAAATSFRLRGSPVEFIIDSIQGVGGSDSGLRFYAASQGLLTYSNMSFFDPTLSTNILSVSTRNQTCVHARVQSSADTSINLGTTGFCSGGNAVFRDAIVINSNSLTASANYTPTCYLNIIANTGYVDGGNNKALRITNGNFVNEFGIHIANANGGDTFVGNVTNTALNFTTNSATRMTITAAGRVGIGTTSPNAMLQVAGTLSSITIVPIGTISYSYDVASNTWTNRGGGPFTLTNVSASFGGNIYIQAGIWATSDRRLKENIKEIDLPIEVYKNLKPVSYNYKNDPKSRVGFVAQDVMQVCAQAITMTENENLRDEGLNSPEGVQLSMDYNAITVLNTDIIKKLIKRIEDLEELLNPRLRQIRKF